MNNNEVYLQGTVKRDAQASPATDTCFVLDFAVEVWNDSAQRFDVFDCRTMSGEDAYDECQGVLSKGDTVALEGMLEKRTRTAEGRVGAATVTLKSTGIIVYVEHFISINDYSYDYDTDE